MPNEFIEVDARGLPTKRQFMRDMELLAEQYAQEAHDPEIAAEYLHLAAIAREFMSKKDEPR